MGPDMFSTKKCDLYPKKATKPLKAIRYFCFECMGWSRTEKDGDRPIDDVRHCTDDLCPLYEFRLGKNPFLKGGMGNPDLLRRYRESKKDSLKIQ